LLGGADPGDSFVDLIADRSVLARQVEHWDAVEFLRGTARSAVIASDCFRASFRF
jgi:hypothetical protein